MDKLINLQQLIHVQTKHLNKKKKVSLVFLQLFVSPGGKKRQILEDGKKIMEKPLLYGSRKCFSIFHWYNLTDRLKSQTSRWNRKLKFQVVSQVYNPCYVHQCLCVGRSFVHMYKDILSYLMKSGYKVQ